MRPEIEQPKTALDFCVLALRTNHPAPCDLTAAEQAEAELHALREDRATIEAMTELLAKEKFRSERYRKALTQIATIHEDAGDDGEVCCGCPLCEEARPIAIKALED